MNQTTSPRTIEEARQAITSELAQGEVYLSAHVDAQDKDKAEFERLLSLHEVGSIPAIVDLQTRIISRQAVIDKFNRFPAENWGRQAAGKYIATHQQVLVGLLKSRADELESPRKTWHDGISKVAGSVYQKLLSLTLTNQEERADLERQRDELETKVATKIYTLSVARSAIERFENITSPTVEDWGGAVVAVNSISFV